MRLSLLLIVTRKCDFDEKMRGTISKTDFSYFCSIAAPEAAAEELRTLCDWGNWVNNDLGMT